MLGETAVSVGSSTPDCVTLSSSMMEAEYVNIAHGAKTASATEVVLDVVQFYLNGSSITIYEENREG